MKNGNVIIVEGIADQYLFEEILRTINVRAEVRVTSPRDHGITYNTKGGVFTTLPLLIKQLDDGRLDRIAIVVDADHSQNHGMGFQKTLDHASGILASAGFRRRDRVGAGGGFMFSHEDGLNSIGLWIMPDNVVDGGVEEWALQSHVDTEAAAVAYADRVVSNVPGGVRYVPLHKPKAQVAAWMSWQSIPGQGLQQAVREQLIDFSKPLPQRLTDWIRAVFP